MRAFLIFILSAVSVFAQAPAYQRNFFDTNTAPVVQVSPGTNITVVYTTTEPAGQVRTYTIHALGSQGAATNFYHVSSSNGTVLIVTNLVDLLYDLNVTNIDLSQFNSNTAYLTTNQLQMFGRNLGVQTGNTQGWYSTTIGRTNYFRSIVAGNGLNVQSNENTVILNVSNAFYGQNLGILMDQTQGVYYTTTDNTNYFRSLVGGDAYGIKIYTNGDNIILSNLYPSIWWFTNALGPSNANSTYTQYVAAGSISNNYNVSIRGLLQLYGYDGNTYPNATNAFNEFWVGGPNFSNTYMGRYAGVNAAIGITNPPSCGGNVMIGYRAGYSNLIGEGNVVIGSHAGQFQRTAIGNVLIGEGVMTAVPTTENSGNTMIGWRVAKDYTTGTGNTLVGKYCANGFVNGTDNTSLGQGSCNIPVGDGNTVLGTAALTASARAYWNIAIGYQAGSAMWSSNNIIIGRASGLNMGGQSNIIIGGAAMIPPALHESSNNIIIGSFAGQGMYTGSCNVLIGDSIGLNNYGVPAGYAMHSNIIIGVNHTPKMHWNTVNKWRLEDSVGIRYNLWPTQSVWIGYPAMTPFTNTVGTNTYELAATVPTNIQFRLLVPTNVVVLATNGYGTNMTAPTVYGTTGDALVNVPFRSASYSTNSPAADEFITRGFLSGGWLQDPGDANIPTNAIPASTATRTNWWFGNIGGIPTLVATNYNGSPPAYLTKPLYP